MIYLIALLLAGGIWAQNDLSDWFRSLRSPSGFPCCDVADGAKVEDPDYRENEDGTYEVMAYGRWFHIPKEKIVTATNRIGYAILWGKPAQDLIYCFMPGARG